MNVFEIDCTEISNIFKENLKVENTLKTISSIFSNSRYLEKVNYAPYFQRNYVWDKAKASYFIESILLGTDIPPIVLFEDGSFLEVIDGRQRFETLLKFTNGEIALKADGMKTLIGLDGKRYGDLSETMRNKFEDTKIRILQFSVVNEPSLGTKQKDKIKREIFNRYNSGITALKTPEIQRAEYNDDKLTSYLSGKLENDNDLFLRSEEMFIAPRMRKGENRDRINHLLSRLRILFTLPHIPIRSYAYAKSKSDIVKLFFKINYGDSRPEQVINNYVASLEKIELLISFIKSIDPDLANNILLRETCYWGFRILEMNSSELFNALEPKILAEAIASADNDEALWTNVPNDYVGLERAFSQTGSHYDKAIIGRYTFVANLFEHLTHLSFSKNLKDPDAYSAAIGKCDIATKYDQFRISKSDPHTESVFDVIRNINRSRFLLRPTYQRSEVRNTTKASYLLESIMLGIKIPPIFVCKREDGVSEVIDGQQRLLSIIGFLGKSYLNENNERAHSVKHMFRLKGLRILDELNGLNMNDVNKMDSSYIDKILDFGIDIIEIDMSQNPHFSPIDLFLRLNQKPYPIALNSFEMWNSYIDRSIIEKAKKISASYPGVLFKSDNSRMKNEELVTVLAYVAYQTKFKMIPTSEVLDIFVRNNKVHARVRGKNNITRTLDEVSESDVDSFLASLDVVDTFLNKLEILTRNGFKNLRKLVSPKAVKTQRVTNQSVYLLWIALVDAETKYVADNSEIIFSDINRSFEEMQTMTHEFSIEKSLDELSKICKG